VLSGDGIIDGIVGGTFEEDAAEVDEDPEGRMLNPIRRFGSR